MRNTTELYTMLKDATAGSSSAESDFSPSAAETKLNNLISQKESECASRPGNPVNLTVVSLKRDDIVRVPTVDGWREPTPYAATWDNRTLIGQDSLPRSSVASVGSWWNGRYYINYNIWVTRGSAVAGFNPAMLPSPSGNSENALLARCYSAVKDKTLDVGMLLLESRESFQTVHSVLRKLRAIIEAVRHKDVGLLHKEFGFKTRHLDKKTGKYTKDAGSLWLEALYGVQPIILDIYNAVELIDKQLREEKFLMVARAEESTQISVRGPQFAVMPSNDGFPSCDFVGDIVSNQRIALWYRLDRPGLALAASLGLTNPLSWLYEKTPLSFVLDWLVPFGQVLSQLDSTLGFTYLGGSRSWRAEGRGMVEAKSWPASISPGYTLTKPPLTLVGERPVSAGVYDRKVYTTPPAVGLYIKDPFSVSNIITTVALIAGRTVR